LGFWDLFFPTDPTVALTGMVDPQRLTDAAAVFPGGAVALVFVLFWAPVGPGIPAGVLLARHAGLNPAFTFGLYATSDILGAFICDPVYRVVRRYGGQVPALRKVGSWAIRVALIGMRPPRAEDVRQGARGTWPALFRIGVVGFGADIYAAGMLVAGLPVPRVAAWGAALVGDLIWFAILLATSIAAAQVTDLTWVQLVIMLVVMFLVPKAAARVFPALRDTPPAPVPAPVAVAESVRSGVVDQVVAPAAPVPNGVADPIAGKGRPTPKGRQAGRSRGRRSKR
jgi:hypothetical protein